MVCNASSGTSGPGWGVGVPSVQWRAAPASVSYWDGAGNASKLTYVQTNSSADNISAAGSGIVNISTNGFMSDFYNASANVSCYQWAASSEL